MSINNDESIENMRMAVVSSIWNLVFRDQDGIDLGGRPCISGGGGNNIDIENDIESQLNGRDIAQSIPPFESHLSSSRSIIRRNERTEKVTGLIQELQRIQRNLQEETREEHSTSHPTVAPRPPKTITESYSANGPSTSTEANGPESWTDVSKPRGKNIRKEVSKSNANVNRSNTEVDNRSEDIDSTQLETQDWSLTDVNRDKYYPKDSYSFLALNGPCMKGKRFSWPMKRVKLFFFGMLPFLFQITFFILLFFHFRSRPDSESSESSSDPKSSDGEHTVAMLNNCTDIVIDQIASLSSSDSESSDDEHTGAILNNCTNVLIAQLKSLSSSDSKSSDEEHTGKMLNDLGFDIVIAQIASLLAYMLYPNSSQQDVVRAIQMYPWCPPDTKDVPIGSIKLSCLARGIQSHCAICVVFLLVMTCDTTLDIILNLTAANFISELDTKAFHLAKSGVFGPGLENEAKRIEKTELPACSYSESKHICYGMLLSVYALIFLTFGIAVAMKESIEYDWLTDRTIEIAAGISLIMLLLTTISSIVTACRNCCRNAEKEEVAGVEMTTHTRSTMPRSSSDIFDISGRSVPRSCDTFDISGRSEVARFSIAESLDMSVVEEDNY